MGDGRGAVGDRRPLVVDLPADGPKRRARAFLGLKRQTNPDDFQGVGEEDGRDSGQASADKATPWGLFMSSTYDDGTDLFVGQELDASIWKDAKEGCRVSSK